MTLTNRQKSNANKHLKELSNHQVEEFMILGANEQLIGKRKITNANITNSQRERILRLIRPFTRNAQYQVTQYITRLTPEDFKKLGITKFGQNFTTDNIDMIHAYPNYFMGGGKARNIGYVQPGSFAPFRFSKHVPGVNKLLWNYKISNEKKRLLRERLNTMSVANKGRRLIQSARRSAVVKAKQEAKKYAKKKAIEYVPSVAKEVAKTVAGLAASALVAKTVVNTGVSVVRGSHLPENRTRRRRSNSNIRRN